jgi:plasminogen activator
MVPPIFKSSCIYFSALFLSVSFPLASFAQSGNAGSTDPGTINLDTLQVVSKPTDSVIVAANTPDQNRATDPYTTTTRNPAGVSSKTNIIEKKAPDNVNDTAGMFSGQISLGLMNGRSKELVYNPYNGHKNSELDWRLENVLMLGAGVSVKPLSWLRFNADLWLKAGDGNGSMDDYDWQVNGWDWTDWSHHNDVTVTEGLLFDINSEFTFLRFNEASVFAILGFRHDHWEWEARGGSYIYSSYYMRDTVGKFPDNALGITYEQTYDTPYLGIGFHANLNPVTLTGRFIGSTMVSSSDKDTHHMRDLVITSSIDSGKMYGMDFACTYNFTPHFAATAAFQYQKYEEIKGTKIWNSPTEGYYQFHYDGGLDNETTLLSLSALVTF